GNRSVHFVQRLAGSAHPVPAGARKWRGFAISGGFTPPPEQLLSGCFHLPRSVPSDFTVGARNSSCDPGGAFAPGRRGDPRARFFFLGAGSVADVMKSGAAAPETGYGYAPAGKDN